MMEAQEYKEKPGSCTACGNSPVQHTTTYIFQTLNVLTGSLWRVLARNSSVARLCKYGRYLGMYGNKVHYFLARMLGIVRFGTDVQRANSYRSQVVWEEAILRNLCMQQVYIFGKPIDVYRVKTKRGWFYFESLPIPPSLPHENYGWFDDKYLLNEALAVGGVPVPRHTQATNVDAVIDWFNNLQMTVITKPRIGSRGRHTTTALATENDVIEGFQIAQELCRFVVLEEHLFGPVCRATIVGGRMCGFLAGYPPTIVGDGHHTIAELITLQNAQRHERVGEIVFSDEYAHFLKRSEYTLSSVPQNTVRVPLTQRTGRLYGGTTEELPDKIHPKLRAYVEQAAGILHVPIVGFDLIIPDPKADPDTQRWGIIEANSLPFIDLHYLPLIGTPSPVAASVWDLWKDLL